jgi:hypothetical protein
LAADVIRPAMSVSANVNDARTSRSSTHPSGPVLLAKRFATTTRAAASSPAIAVSRMASALKSGTLP